ncbi:MAG: threonyl-tRNA synthetase [Anaerocolumna sp.]|jgi:hypothetical protein|nr:threonyl-tRNA synthetase [Anaerocolumna sp.]
MNEKIIDFKKSVYDLCSTDSDVIEILAQLGFKDITKPGMLNTAGRFMTIPKGAAMKKIDLNLIKDEFNKHGFKVLE